MRIYLEGEKKPIYFSLSYYHSLRNVSAFKRFLHIFSDQITFIITCPDEVNLKKLTTEKTFQHKRASLMHNKKILAKWESPTFLVYNVEELAKYAKTYNSTWPLERELIPLFSSVFSDRVLRNPAYEFVGLSDCSPDSPELQLLKAVKAL